VCPHAPGAGEHICDRHASELEGKRVPSWVPALSVKKIQTTLQSIFWAGVVADRNNVPEIVSQDNSTTTTPLNPGREDEDDHNNNGEGEKDFDWNLEKLDKSHDPASTPHDHDLSGGKNRYEGEAPTTKPENVTVRDSPREIKAKLRALKAEYDQKNVVNKQVMLRVARAIQEDVCDVTHEAHITRSLEQLEAVFERECCLVTEFEIVTPPPRPDQNSEDDLGADFDDVADGKTAQERREDEQQRGHRRIFSQFADGSYGALTSAREPVLAGRVPNTEKVRLNNGEEVSRPKVCHCVRVDPENYRAAAIMALKQQRLENRDASTPDKKRKSSSAESESDLLLTPRSVTPAAAKPLNEKDLSALVESPPWMAYASSPISENANTFYPGGPGNGIRKRGDKLETEAKKRRSPEASRSEALIRDVFDSSQGQAVATLAASTAPTALQLANVEYYTQSTKGRKEEASSATEDDGNRQRDVDRRDASKPIELAPIGIDMELDQVTVLLYSDPMRYQFATVARAADILEASPFWSQTPSRRALVASLRRVYKKSQWMLF
ncbi:unnamed protein product, partial [Amoebophrya sp. A25]